MMIEERARPSGSSTNLRKAGLVWWIAKTGEVHRRRSWPVGSALRIKSYLSMCPFMHLALLHEIIYLLGIVFHIVHICTPWTASALHRLHCCSPNLTLLIHPGPLLTALISNHILLYKLAANDTRERSPLWLRDAVFLTDCMLVVHRIRSRLSDIFV